MAVSYSKDVGRSKHELLDEISRLRKELRSKDQEIETLKGKIKLYKAL